MRIKWILLAILTVALAVWLARYTGAHADFYEVLEVNDGDTVIVDMSGRKETVRFIGVDTPETHHPNVPGIQCYAVEAGKYLKKTLGKQRVRLVADSKSTNRDRYNRLLRYVYDESGKNLNLDLVVNGYGFAITGFRFSLLQEFVMAQQQAQAKGRGLWSACEVKLNKSGYYSTQIVEQTTEKEQLTNMEAVFLNLFLVT